MRRFLLVIIGLLLVSTSYGQQVADADYLVYDTIIRASQRGMRSVVIVNQTTKQGYSSPWPKYFEPEQNWSFLFRTPFDSTAYALCRNFEKQDSVANWITNRFSVPVKTFLTERAKLNQLFEASTDVDSGWQRFYRQYPRSGGYMDFSNVLYSADRNMCVAYYGVHRYGLNGGGYLCILRKLHGKWKIREKGVLWQN